MKTFLTFIVSLLVAALIQPSYVFPVTVGQIDTFTDGTTMGWFVPAASPNPPANESTGGPSGAGDAFIRLLAFGQPGPGGRLSVLNGSQWTGNYLASGVTSVRMDVNNFGPSDLHLRLLFEDFDLLPGPPVNLALSAQAIIVPAGSGWMTASFPITPADLVVETYGTVIGALSDTDTLRIFHNPDPAFPGPAVGIPLVNVILGVDNIAALSITPVTEPATMLLLGSGLLGLAGLRKKFKK